MRRQAREDRLKDTFLKDRLEHKYYKTGSTRHGQGDRFKRQDLEDTGSSTDLTGSSTELTGSSTELTGSSIVSV